MLHAVCTQQSLRLKEAAALLQLQQQKALPAVTDNTESDVPVVATSPPRSQRQQAVLDLIGHCVSALQQGVKRTHLVPPVDGGLIEVQQLHTYLLSVILQ
jgi:hypothetical protein